MRVWRVRVGMAMRRGRDAFPLETLRMEMEREGSLQQRDRSEFQQAF